MNPKYELATLGCKVNQYESQQLRELLDSHGWSPASPGEVPDLAIVNTCAVTAAAARKSRQLGRRAGRNGRTRVMLVGCCASADPDRLAKLPGVQAVWGHDTNVPARLARLLAAWNRARAGPLHAVDPQGSPSAPPAHQGRSIGCDDSAGSVRAGAAPLTLPHRPREGIYAPVIDATPARAPVKQGAPFSRSIRGFDGHRRAFVKVQDGCDACCTYCVIPTLRARLGFRPLADLVSEVADLVEAGYREVVLTGIFLGAYGRRTARRRQWDPGPQPLAELVAAVAGVPGLARLRLSSLEPGDVTPELLEVMASNPACVPHLHLPLQAGSDRILRRMNRQYRREAFEAMVNRVRDAFDRPALTTDILVGFPSETDADFADTLAVARQTGFCKIHAFPFSPRQGTAAARWTDQFVPAPVLARRMATLAKLEQELSLRYRRLFVGQSQRVLVERCVPDSDGDYGARRHGQSRTSGALKTDLAGGRFLLVGRTDRYFEVHLEAGADLTGQLVTVRITRVTPRRTYGALA